MISSYISITVYNTVYIYISIIYIIYTYGPVSVGPPRDGDGPFVYMDIYKVIPVCVYPYVYIRFTYIHILGMYIRMQYVYVQIYAVCLCICQCIPCGCGGGLQPFSSRANSAAAACSRLLESTGEAAGRRNETWG